MLYVRYKFESNSQHSHGKDIHQLRCVCYTLDTSLKAIHNNLLPTYLVREDVYAIR